jgi:hypothetical protein
MYCMSWVCHLACVWLLFDEVLRALFLLFGMFCKTAQLSPWADVTKMLLEISWRVTVPVTIFTEREAHAGHAM